MRAACADGGVAAGGASACPALLLPQHSISLFSRIAQVCAPLALITVNLPEGALSWRLLPQHAISPFARIAQLCVSPTLTAV